MNIKKKFSIMPTQLQVYPWGSNELKNQLPTLNTKFHLIFSSMGALNCEYEIEGLLKTLNSHLVKKGLIILSVMNRKSWWLLLKRFIIHKSLRYSRKIEFVRLGSYKVPTVNYELNDFKKLKKSGFKQLSLFSFPCLLPPPNFLPKVKSSKFLSLISKFEIICKISFFRNYGDHIILIAQKE
jgi:hypothetical protein